MALHYDNDPSHFEVPSGYMAVERVYALKHGEFAEAQWQQLASVFESLPEWQGAGDHGCSCWFGRSEAAPYLLASVEPSGLQVSGIVTASQWQSWNERFVAQLGNVPTFEV